MKRESCERERAQDNVLFFSALPLALASLSPLFAQIHKKRLFCKLTDRLQISEITGINLAINSYFLSSFLF